MLYLLDTDILIDWFTQGPGQAFVEEKIRTEACKWISSWICAAEFLIKASSKEEKAFLKLLDSGELDLKELQGLAALQLVVECRRKTGLRLPDTIILATAKLEKARLVTRDRALSEQGRQFYPEITLLA